MLRRDSGAQACRASVTQVPGTKTAQHSPSALRISADPAAVLPSLGRSRRSRATCEESSLTRCRKVGCQVDGKKASVVTARFHKEMNANGAVDGSNLETAPVFSILEELENWADQLKALPLALLP